MSATIGILALQGDFASHQETLARIGISSVQIRHAEQLRSTDGLIIPGGESTTLIKLMKAYGFIGPLQEFHKSGRAIFGTCAGSILLAKSVDRKDQFSFDFIDMNILRNGYGRQVNSFEADIDIKGWGAPLHGVFIRAPRITATGKNVQILANHGSDPVMAISDNILVTTFHPELSGDTRVHEYFVKTLVERI